MPVHHWITLRIKRKQAVDHPSLREGFGVPISRLARSRFVHSAHLYELTRNGSRGNNAALYHSR